MTARKQRFAAWVWLLISLGFVAGCESRSENGSGSAVGTKPTSVTLLNVSYDPTREFYQEFNAAFAKHWKEKAGQDVTVDQSHGGSGKQARAVMDGLEADVVTLALAYDIEAIAKKAQLLPLDWQSRFEHRSSPYTSTIVFLVRKGNPKGIKDWGDLVRDDVSVITSNPKTGGGARWNYLAAWGFELKRQLGDFSKLKNPEDPEVVAAQGKAQEFVTQLYKRVPVLDPAARGAINTFMQRGIGDVILTWENEARLALKDGSAEEVEFVAPSLSILAEPPVAVVDRFAEKHGNLEVARGYLEYLYSPIGQELAAKHFYRPIQLDTLPEELKKNFVPIETFTIDEVFGGWDAAQAKHFDDGGLFDQIYQPQN